MNVSTNVISGEPDPWRDIPTSPRFGAPLARQWTAERHTSGARSTDDLEPPFVGRVHERAVLASALEAAAAGSGTVVFVGGESGSGKSRLIHEAARDARSNGWRVARDQYLFNAPQVAVDAPTLSFSCIGTK